MAHHTDRTLAHCSAVRPDRGVSSSVSELEMAGPRYIWCKAVRLFCTILGMAYGTIVSAQEILPFPPTPSASTAGLTMKDSTYKKRVETKHLAEGAPNILIILMDDLGPGTPSTYGGEVNTPTLSRIAQMGISFNRFHSTAMCSPTRASLLTGRNHTFVGNGQISAIANDFDGFSGIVPKSSATVAEVLKDYGYNTAAPVASGTTRPKTRSPPRGRSTIGRPAMASNISTDSSPARPRSTNRP